jgi:hypothetical protein
VTPQVTHPLTRIVPISIFQGWGQLYHLLWYYKENRSDVAAGRLRIHLTAIVTRFLRDHAEHVAPDGWDIIAPVPSTGGREGVHPLRTALGQMPGYSDQVEDLLFPGEFEIRHLVASDGGFDVRESVDGRRILLVDDTFTSGARMQSAASALRLAGADVVAGLVVGRKYFDDDKCSAVYQYARNRQFSFDVCCVDEAPWDVDPYG